MSTAARNSQDLVDQLLELIQANKGLFASLPGYAGCGLSAPDDKDHGSFSAEIYIDAGAKAQLGKARRLLPRSLPLKTSTGMYHLPVRVVTVGMFNYE